MSHTNSTPNYNLPQYVGSDIINPLTDTNGAYSDIDTALKQIADSVADDTADITNLKTKVGTDPLTTDAQTLSGAVNELDAELNTASTGVVSKLTSAENDIDVLQSQMTTATGNITTLQQNVTTLDTKISNVGKRLLATVTADGVKTIGALMTELGAQLSGATEEQIFDSFLIQEGTGFYNKLPFIVYNSGTASYGLTSISSTLANAGNNEFSTDGTARRIQWTAADNSITIISLNSVVPASGEKYSIYY